MSRIDIELIPYAEKLGFIPTADRLGLHPSGVPYNPWTFVKGPVIIWYVGPNRVNVTLPKEAQKGDWMVADLIDERFTNHRAYDGLKAALDAEAKKFALASLRPDIKVKLIAENAISLDDVELERVFAGVALELFCIKEVQRARAAGITMLDISTEPT
jgi:hypothetical protein